MFEHLGIIHDADGKIVNHRSILKIVVNPFLRYIGFVIGTYFDEEKQSLEGLRLCRHPRKWLGWKMYVLEPGWYVEKRRRLV